MEGRLTWGKKGWRIRQSWVAIIDPFSKWFLQFVFFWNVSFCWVSPIHWPNEKTLLTKTRGMLRFSSVPKMQTMWWNGKCFKDRWLLGKPLVFWCVPAEPRYQQSVGFGPCGMLYRFVVNAIWCIWFFSSWEGEPEVNCRAFALGLSVLVFVWKIHLKYNVYTDRCIVLTTVDFPSEQIIEAQAF